MIKCFTIGIFLVLIGFGNTNYIDGNDGKGCAYQCYAYTGIIRTHSEARNACNVWGGTLVIPDTAATMEYLRTLCNVKKEIHVGGEKRADNKFYWSTGVEVGSNGYSGWPSGGGDKSRNYMGMVHHNGEIYWKSVDKAEHYICQKIDESATSTITACKNNNGDYKRTAEYCHGICFCKYKYYGDICEFTKPVIESCDIHPTSSEPVFPLNITCNITGFPVNEKTIIQWKADENILANNTDDVVFYRDDVSIVKTIATLVLKRGICLGSLEIKLVVTQTFNAKPLTPNSKKIFMGSNFSLLSDLSTNSPSCNGSITNVQWNSNAPNHLQSTVQYSITTLPETRTLVTNRTQYTLTGLKPKTTYKIKIVSSSNKACRNGYMEQVTTNITTGYSKPTPEEFDNTSEARNIGEQLCGVSWSYHQPSNVESYKILISGETIHARSYVTFPPFKYEVTITSANKTSYWARTMPPNKKYSFGIYATNCAGNGPTMNITGNCFTPTQPPSMLQRPKFLSASKVDKEERIDITVEAVDEENGPVSCKLVVVTTKELQNNDTLIKQNQFTEMTNTIGHIAYCIKDVGLINVTLGGNEVTYCNPGDSVMKKRSTNNYTLTGNNKPLNRTSTYSIYLVTVSNVNDSLLYRRSQPIVTTPWVDPVSKSATGTVTGVLLALAIAITVSVILLWRWRKGKSLFNKSPMSAEDETMMDMHGYSNIEVPRKRAQRESVGFSEDPSFVTMKEIEIVVLDKIKNKLSTAKDEFNKLATLTTSQQSHNIASTPENKTKNRFKNIYSYDHSRVSLNSGTNAYINASYIDGYKSSKKFIATQGPLESTVKDFWQMIHEQNVSVIVMLTNCVERSKNKCFQYWPDTTGLMKLSNLSIKLNEERFYGGFIKRAFLLTGDKNTPKLVTQFHMTTWPDHGIPMITSTILTLHKHVVELASLNEKAPIVVHCSAGVGRTGTFIGLDICHNQMRNEGRVSFEHCITTMRRNRVQMIQTFEQYLFLQKLVVESFSNLFSKVKTDDFIKETSTDSCKLSLKKSFEVMKSIIPMHFSTEKSKMEFTGSKIFPYDVNAVTFTVDTENFVYNASYIYDYYGKKNLVIAEHPNQDKYDLYWNMIKMKDVNIIVCLDDIDMVFLENRSQYAVQTKTENDFCDIVELQIQSVYSNEDSSSDKIIFGKMEQECIEGVLFRIMLTLQNIKSDTNNTICVQSRSNPELPGIFCASLNAIEQAKIEQEIDVIQAVKDVNDMRPNAITSFESVQTCVKVVNEHLKANSVYENFDS